MRRIIVKVMLVSLVAVAVAVAAGLTLIPRTANAEFPGNNGRIVFQKLDSDGFWQTWVANKDLKNQVKLTSESADSGWAVWKPGGSKLAFESNRADPHPNDSDFINDIFKMNPDGSGIVKLTHSDDLSDNAAWSPDGKQIAFGSDRRHGAERREIYVMNADGSHARRVSTLPDAAFSDEAPRFSPDGNRLVFTRYINEPAPAALFTVRLDGSGLRQLTPWGNGAGDADFSPDGKKLVFEANPNKNCYGEIYTVEADGQHLTNITDNRCQAGSADPVWSPDGTKILFMQAHAFSGGFGFDLATMNPDGGTREFILGDNPNTNSDDEKHQPDWESLP